MASIERNGWPDPIIQRPEERGNIAIRGLLGELGSNIAGAVAQQQGDLALRIGIIHDGPSMKLRGEAIWEAHPNIALRADGEDVAPLRTSGLEVNPLTHNGLISKCDLLIDATGPGEGQEFALRIKHQQGSSQIPIVVQSGERGFGRLVVPPVISPRKNHEHPAIFRMGDCNENGIVPILNALKDVIDRVHIEILMQFGRRHHTGLLRRERVVATSYVSSGSIQESVQGLLPQLDINFANLITQVGMLRFYTHTYNIHFRLPVDTGEIIELLDKHPRIRCLPNAKSTYQVQTYHDTLVAAGRGGLPPIVPIMIKGGTPFEHSEELQMSVAIDSQRITALPNVDTARTLLFDVDPVEAMRITDKNMGLTKK